MRSTTGKLKYMENQMGIMRVRITAHINEDMMEVRDIGSGAPSQIGCNEKCDNTKTEFQLHVSPNY